MIPQSGQFLKKAHKLLAEGELMLVAKFYDAAGRNAYLVAFHAAQAFIFERTEKVSKTHSGVNREFLRLTKDMPERSDLLRTFLSVAYNLKASADYDTTENAEISPARAQNSMMEAREFLMEVERLIA